MEPELEFSGTHLFTAKDGELTASRAHQGSPCPHPGAAHSYSILPMNVLASEEVETRKKPWKGMTIPSSVMKSTWKMENRMAPLLPESLSLDWEQEGTSVDQARHPSTSSRIQRPGWPERLVSIISISLSQATQLRKCFKQTQVWASPCLWPPSSPGHHPKSLPCGNPVLLPPPTTTYTHTSTGILRVPEHLLCARHLPWEPSFQCLLTRVQLPLLDHEMTGGEGTNTFIHSSAF